MKLSLLISILRRCVVMLLRFVLCGANNFFLCINIVNIRSFCFVLEVMFCASLPVVSCISLIPTVVRKLGRTFKNDIKIRVEIIFKFLFSLRPSRLLR